MHLRYVYLNKEDRNMSSVVKRISEIKQPRGGYLKPSLLTSTQLQDNNILNENENVSPMLVGLAVDYLTRFMISKDADKAFEISMMGAFNSGIKHGCAYGYTDEFGDAKDKLDIIKKNNNNLSDIVIVCACKLCTFDVWYRNPRIAAEAQQSYDAYPDNDTIRNIRIMVNRALKFIDQYGPVIKYDFDFKPNGYTKTVTAGDGDFLTADTLWDFKVSKNKPTNKHTLQLMMYYIMGKHSGQSIYDSVHSIGIFNPRLNTAYTYDIDDKDLDMISDIEQNVIVY